MHTLTGISITFDTHDDSKEDTSLVHVFVTNRLNSTRTPQPHSDFIGNKLELERHQDGGDLATEHNPYLASGEGLGAGHKFADPSSTTFALTLTSRAIDVSQVVLPAVSIHFATQDSGTDDRWVFDYSLIFTFVDDETGQANQQGFSSVRDGLRGVILDKDNHDHYRILSEKFSTPPALDQPVTDAVLSRVTLDLVTHKRHDDNKDFDTRLNVHVVNRLSATSAQDIAIGLNLFPGQEFTPESKHTFSWSSSPGDGALAGGGIRLADVVLPVVYIIIVPNGHDQWTFDYQVTYEFTDPHSVTGKQLVYSSRTGGVILDQDNPKHEGVYQGAPFPTVSPPTAPALTERPVNHVTTPKKISIPFLQNKLGEFVNSRTGSLSDPNPPLLKIRMDNAGRVPGDDDITPESFLDLQSLEAGKDAETGKADVHYVSSPSSLTQLDYHQRLQDINSSAISLTIDGSSRTPLKAVVLFETGGPVELASTSIFVFDIDFKEFSITLHLTLDLAQTTDASGNPRTLVNVLSWVAELEDIRKNRTGTFLGEPVDLGSDDDDDLAEHITDHAEKMIDISLETNHPKDPERLIRRTLVDKIYAKLSTPDLLTGRTARDALNGQVTSLLLGGIADDDHNTDQNNTIIHELGIEIANPEFGIPEDSIVISYTGPRKVFVPARPASWPAGHDFSPGALANIEHLVVLTMENRSFDHILGYLSLPVSSGGQGRTDVDGLTGHESNPYQGTSFPSFPFTDTIFSPDPPHGYEPVHHAINGGRMDGFVKSFAEERGDQLAGQIMGHQTAATVPVHDALARDFSIGHRWFAAHPGPTFCNRFYELTGRLNLDARGFWEFDNSSPTRTVFTETIFDHLQTAKDPTTGQPVTWTYYEHGYCYLRLFERYTFDHTNIRAADDPEFGFFAAARAGRLPNVSFIDPHFVELPPGGNCDGAPADLALGQDLVRRVVEAVVSSPAWDKTMLVIVYDEHGGFYDHVPPPSAARVSDDLPITTYGVRVPVMVVSPWVGQGTVFGHDAGAAGHPAALVFDHTSILKTIARRFLSKNPPFMGARYAAANDLSSVMLATPRTPQFRPFIPYTLRFNASGLMLDVQSGNPAPGAPLVQSATSGGAEQDFAFEDAGNGFMHLRSRLSNLYVTVREPAAAGSPPTVVQDVRYPTGPGQPQGHRPELQRWKLTSTAIDIVQRGNHVISSQAHPDKQLQPADPTVPGSPVVLGAPAASGPAGHGRTNWKVTSRLLPDDAGNQQ